MNSLKCKKWLPVIAACPVISSSIWFGKQCVLPDRAQFPTWLWDKVHIITPFNFIAKHFAFHLLAKVNCKQMSMFCIEALILAFSSLINCPGWWTGILKKCVLGVKYPSGRVSSGKGYSIYPLLSCMHSS